MPDAIDLDLLQLVDELQSRYIRSLDTGDLDLWLSCFDEAEGSYICTTRENVEQGLPIAFMLDCLSSEHLAQIAA